MPEAQGKNEKWDGDQRERRQNTAQGRREVGSREPWSPRIEQFMAGGAGGVSCESVIRGTLLQGRSNPA